MQYRWYKSLNKPVNFILLRIIRKKNSSPKVSKIRKLPLLPTTRILVVGGATQCSEQTGRSRSRSLHMNVIYAPIPLSGNEKHTYPDEVCVWSHDKRRRTTKIILSTSQNFYSVAQLWNTQHSMIFSLPPVEKCCRSFSVKSCTTHFGNKTMVNTSLPTLHKITDKTKRSCETLVK